MSNYLKGLLVSFGVHAAVIATVIVMMDSAAISEKDFFIVDFSTVETSVPLIESSESSDGHHASPVEAIQEKVKPQSSPARKNSRTRVPGNAKNIPIKPRQEFIGQQGENVVPEEIRQKKENLYEEVDEKNDKVTGNTQSGRMESLSASRLETGKEGGTVSSAENDVHAGKEKGENTTDVSGEKDQAQVKTYVRHHYNYIMKHIRKNLIYPSQARRMGMTGTSVYVFVIKENGDIDHLSLRASSGYDILDEAAKNAIIHSAPFPPPPVPARIVVPVTFDLM